MCGVHLPDSEFETAKSLIDARINEFCFVPSATSLTDDGR
jgi:hypothetical protein